MDFSSCIKLIKSDYKRSCNKLGYPKKWKSFFFLYRLCFDDSFAFMFWFRVCSYISESRKRKMLLFPLLLYYKHIGYKYGIEIPLGTSIGEGFRFGHHSCIVLAKSVKIGRNCTIAQGVTIGRIFGGKKAGCPTIGDCVVISAGAKILGGIRIGNNVVVGANAVVVHDIPDNSVAAGVPAKIISEDSSKCFNEEWQRIFFGADINLYNSNRYVNE